MLWNLYRRLNGTSNCDYESYWALPAIYVEACDIIESEIALVKRHADAEIKVKDMLNKKRR